MSTASLQKSYALVSALFPDKSMSTIHNRRRSMKTAMLIVMIKNEERIVTSALCKSSFRSRAMVTSSALPKHCNAWIFLNEDASRDANGQYLLYPEKGSSYQQLITEGVYKCVDMLFICFAEIVPTGPSTVPTGDGSSHTLQMGAGSHSEIPGNPVQYTNQDYLEFVIRNSRSANPSIKILMTLVWGNGNEINNIFQDKSKTEEKNAADFADNLVAYLRSYNLDGFDIDWEKPLSADTNEARASIVLTAVAHAFSQQNDRKFWLVLSPVTVRNLDSNVVNKTIDFLNLQLYGGTHPIEYISAGIKTEKLAFGPKFESEYQTAEQAFSAYQVGGYRIASQWRLNSDNYEFEQDQQKRSTICSTSADSPFIFK